MNWLSYFQELYKKCNLYILLLSVAVSSGVFLRYLKATSFNDAELIASLLLIFCLSYLTFAFIWVNIRSSYNRSQIRQSTEEYAKQKEKALKEEINGKFSALWSNERTKREISQIYNLPKLHYKNQRNLPSQMRWSMDIFDIRLRNGHYLIGIEDMTSDVSLLTFEPYFYELLEEKMK